MVDEADQLNTEINESTAVDSRLRAAGNEPAEI